MRFSFSAIILFICICATALGDSLFLKNINKSIDITIIGFKENYLTAEISQNDLKSLSMQFPEETFDTDNISLKLDDITIQCKVETLVNNRVILSIPTSAVSSLHMSFDDYSSQSTDYSIENEYLFFTPKDNKTRKIKNQITPKKQTHNKSYALHSQSLPDELITVDGIYIQGELLKITDTSITFLQDGENVCNIRLENVSVFSRNNEIIKVYSYKNKQPLLSILKPAHGENISIKNIDISAFKTLDSVDATDKTIIVQEGKPFSKPADIASTTKYSMPQQLVQTDIQKPEKKTDSDQTTAEDKDKTVAVAEEGKIIPSPQKTWKGSVESGVNIKTGNTKSTTTHLKLGFLNERKRDKISFDMLAIFETQKNEDTDDSEETADEQRATVKYEYNTSFRIYLYLQEYFEHDEIEDLSYRTITSFGPGFRLINKEKLKYRFEGGPAYTFERFHGGAIEKYSGLRFGQFFDWQMLNTTTLFAKNEYTVSMEDQEDWRIDSSFGVKHSLIKALSLSTELLNQYDNTPAEGNQKDDTTLIGSIGYNF
ncbi:MAG: DUF481 domain-containing protein [Planctomycetes bacterium]|nr:DUF481 domain-containing protein [Planctomycetota bacterium]